MSLCQTFNVILICNKFLIILRRLYEGVVLFVTLHLTSEVFQPRSGGGGLILKFNHFLTCIL